MANGFVFVPFRLSGAHCRGNHGLGTGPPGGKRTTATLLGRQKPGVMLVLLLLEVYLLYFWFQDAVLAGFLAVFSGWLVLDLFFIFKGKPYTLWQMKLLVWAMNGVAFASMLWVLYSGKLMHPVFRLFRLRLRLRNLKFAFLSKRTHGQVSF